ncbi:hypothetical protein HH310_21455 [Actinoplanes sp. TBRC 11911]|uniref:hypothetical protein n=1 Tax=Actinoplanes sp. TBRC 11911 TaxID=2729386 RepID=UPI00145D2384|nr:hypothetical protein [Actinoplanes sp. TBRC 11911]NMO53740.1 hypothetical protein [Actinoplanes sp. TBRC 11911]
MSQLPKPPYPGLPAGVKDRTFPIVLTVVVVLLVLCAGGGSAAAFLVRPSQDDKVSAAGAPPSPAPTPVPAEPAAPAPAPTVKIVAPTTLGGRVKVQERGLQATADMLKGRISGPTDTSSVSAVYGKPGTKNQVLMAASAGPDALPFQEVQITLTIFGMDTVGVVNPSTGSLGGNATCANTVVAGQKAAVCVWADEGSLGLVVFLAKSATAVAAEFPKLRAEIEKKA